MKDKDLEDIGKRLYDLEADPPKKGWDKIYGQVNTTGYQRARWIRKNWWKPLIVLLIPAGIYFTVSNTDHAGSRIASNIENDSSKRIAEKQANDTTTNNRINESETRLKKGEVKTESNINPEQSTSIKTKTIKKSVKATPSAISRNTVNEHDRQNVTVKESAAERTKEIETSRLTIASVNPTASDSGRKTENPSSAETTHNDTRHNDAQSTTAGQANANMTQDEEGLDTTSLVARSGRIAAERPVEKKSNEKAVIAGESKEWEETTADPASVIVEDQKKNNNNKNQVVASAPGSKEEASTDSLASVLIQNKPDTTTATASPEETHSLKGKWRLSGSFTPHYVQRTILPVADDDILVTSINKNASGPKRVGYGIAAGIGRYIGNNVVVDAQLSFTQLTQDISFSYSTGKVDTLIGIKQPDGTFIVKPVYQLTNSETVTRFSYGGVRLMGTYYFWNKGRRRFSITAGGNLNYLINGNIRQSINGTWTTLSSESLDKMTYSVVVGAGYNVSFAKGWEIMINPNITYYPGKVKITDAPFNVNQRAYGINFMVSRTIGKI